MALLSSTIAGFGTALDLQRGQLFCWVPICFAVGIGIYFALPVEPTVRGLVGLVGCMLLFGGLGRYCGDTFTPLFWAIALICFGGVWAGLRAHTVAAPVLETRYYGPVEGRVVMLDRSVSGAVRVTLDQVILSRRSVDRTPDRVRIALHGDQRWHEPKPGERVVVTAHLSPPSGAAEPRGFDFRRHAWFQRLGAVGYARTPLLLLEPQARRSLAGLRLKLSRHIQTALPGDPGAVAAALITGDRMALPQARVNDLRRANLAHLLAISGLHMGLVCGFVFAALRLMMAAVPYIALRWPTKKIAAAVALLAGLVYLGVAGGGIATQRAFVMATVILFGVILDRRAISMRAVAAAAIVLLILHPETLLTPGFQMSFAATCALVVGFALVRDAGRLPTGWRGWLVTLLMSSMLAGGATAPFAAAHFNMVSYLGLLANLLTVPLMGALIMPAAVMAVICLPFGLEAVPLWGMGQGISWILLVAQWVSAHEFSVGFVASPTFTVLPLLSLGSLWICLWNGWPRWLGALAVVAAAALWATTPRPDLLISDTGGLVGVMTKEGRALSRAKGSSFVAGVWLENDGSPITQEDAADLWPAVVRQPSGEVRVVFGKKAAAEVTCRKGDWLISNHIVEPRGLCRVFDPQTLAQTGSVVVYDLGGEAIIQTARQYSGDRLWTAWHAE